MHKLTVIALCCALIAGCSLIKKGTGSARLLGGGTEARDATLAYRADNTFGPSLSGKDWKSLKEAEVKALDYGKPGTPTQWKSGRKDRSGSVSASQPYQVGTSDCRRFQHILNDGVAVQKVSGTACKSGEGNWELIS